MKIWKPIVITALAVTLVACSDPDRSRTDLSRDATEEPIAADNTGMNQRDQNEANLTPMDQGGSEADRTVTQNIRKAIMANDALSMNAKNVKIITLNGVVTLRGPVDNAQEKQTIADAARAIAGADRVTDELEIAGTVGK